MPPLTRPAYDRRDLSPRSIAAAPRWAFGASGDLHIVIARSPTPRRWRCSVAGFIRRSAHVVRGRGLQSARSQNDWPVDTAEPHGLGQADCTPASDGGARCDPQPASNPRIITANSSRRRGLRVRFIAASFYYAILLALDGQDRLLTRDPSPRQWCSARGRLFLSIFDGRKRSNPQLLGQWLGPLRSPWLFLSGTAVILPVRHRWRPPAAVVLIPVVFPIAEAMGHRPRSTLISCRPRRRDRPVRFPANPMASVS